MIRVGFILTFRDQGWLGGINYFRNLLGALEALPGRRVEPVLLTAPDTDQSIIASLPPFETVVARELRQSNLAWAARRAAARLLGRDVPLAQLASRLRLRLVSHQGFFAPIGAVPLLGWIPDFQELHLPEFFTPDELRARSRKAQRFCRDCARILLSSESARADLARINKVAAARASVLRFVALVPSESGDPAELRSRLEIAGRYLHLPNQFWAHKNHRVVVEALAILKRRGQAVQILATGNPADHRQPGYFRELMDYVARAGVAANFRCLGTLPYVDLISLMRESVAVINPSLFEGWSTTVEEAKSLGKCVLLSDLPVHREQAPPRGVFFDPRDPAALAEKLWQIWTMLDPQEDRLAATRAANELPGRRAAFARTYEEIVLEVVAGRKSRRGHNAESLA
jgi:glycosyltransferase involved in cell wall biosynthesis